MAGKHPQQTSGVPQNPPVLSQQTTLGSRRLLIETLIHIPLVEVILVLETPIQEDIPDKTQETLPVEVTLTNLEEGITQTKTLQVGILQPVATPTNPEEEIIPTNTLQVGILQLEAIQVLGDIPTNPEEAIIPTSTLQVGTLRLEAFQLLGDIPTSQAEAAIQTSIQVAIQQLVDIQSEEGALGRAGVHQALTLEVILVVE